MTKVQDIYRQALRDVAPPLRELGLNGSLTRYRIDGDHAFGRLDFQSWKDRGFKRFTIAVWAMTREEWATAQSLSAHYAAMSASRFPNGECWWQRVHRVPPGRGAAPWSVHPATDHAALAVPHAISGSGVDCQVARLSAWAVRARGVVCPCGGRGRVGRERFPRKVCRLLAFRVTGVVVECRDRLGWVNAEFVVSALAGYGRRLVVFDGGGVIDDLVRDMVEVLISLCARLYGRRSVRMRVLKALGVRAA